MTLNKLLSAGLLATALLTPSLALAQGAPAPAPAPAEATPAAAPAPGATPPAQNWLKVCDPMADGKKACVMRQVVLNNGQFQGSFLLQDNPGQESRLMAIAAVPLGVLLPFGLTWQIDGDKPVRVPYMMCDPVACVTQLVINEAYVNSLKKGAVLKLTAKNRQNKDLVIDISLAGFTAAYDNDQGMTFEEYRKESSGASALEKGLQDRAEEIRKSLNVEAPAPAPAPQ